ncbi:lipopolysaccharide kinase InaA family protein [Marinilabilia sp.]
MQTIKIKSHIPGLEDFLKNLPIYFEKEGITLKKGRNEIKIFDYGDFRLCVKAFKKVTLFNRMMYSWFRKTKAQRSYEIAEKLLSKGIDTPLPLGYTIVTGKWRILRVSFYVSIFNEDDFTLSEVFSDLHFADKEKILREYAEWMALNIHSKGILHEDMSAGNVLIRKSEDGHFSFSLIDLNRIKIKKQISHRKGLRNLRKINNRPSVLAFLAEHYAQVSKGDPGRYAFSLIGSQLLFSNMRRLTKSFLHCLVPKKELRA